MNWSATENVLFEASQLENVVEPLSGSHKSVCIVISTIADADAGVIFFPNFYGIGMDLIRFDSHRCESKLCAQNVV